MFITFSASQFKQVWCWDVDQMLYFTLEKYKKCQSFRGSAPDPAGELTALLLTPKLDLNQFYV